VLSFGVIREEVAPDAEFLVRDMEVHAQETGKET